MFSKKFKQNQNQFGGFDERFGFQNQYMNNQPYMEPNPMYPNFQYDRIQYEIKENRRRINNLAKRITRIENYLRIKDNSDYIIDEDNIPNGYSL